MKFVSVNIEGDKHWNVVLPFLKRERPDVICLQEIFNRDVEMLKKELNMAGSFAPLIMKSNPSPMSWGIAVLTAFPVRKSSISYYSGNPSSLNLWDSNADNLTNTKKMALALLTLVIGAGEKDVVIGTTHFTWTTDGQVNEFQRRDLQSLFAALDQSPEIVFSGDFNAPRGGEIFGEIARRYTDNIPTRYTTSIDGNLHRAGHLQLMVDGLFSTPQYRVENVRLMDGVSDHCAVVADVSRAE